jgi:hypothetical protein
MTPVYEENKGVYVTPDGSYYNTPQEAQYFHVLDLCGCGDPYEVHAFLIECAKCFDRGNGDEDWYKCGGVDAIQKLVAEKPDVAAEFIAHFLDQRGLTEHGGSVYGSWMTEEGRDFIEAGAMEE